MRKLLVRGALSSLAAVALATTATTTAQADPPARYHDCKRELVADGYVDAEICVNTTVAENNYVNATFRVFSALPYPVSVRADLIVGSTVYTGVTTRIEPYTEGGSYTETVVNPPLGSLRGHGNVSAGLWWWDVYNK